jgi:formate hydrogenlyase subunit 6/NADH:ubiquinone oxidoreductase subunit I
MSAYRIDCLTTLQKHLSKQYRVFQPMQDELNQWHWKQDSSSGGEYKLPERPGMAQFSPKSFFFRERENLFKFDGESFKLIAPDESSFVLFGVSACELTAIAYQDKFFKDDFYYQKRRKSALLVGMDCTKVCNGGFCPTVNSGPFIEYEHADLILFDANTVGSNEWWIVIASEKGNNALKDLSLLPAPDRWLNKRSQQHMKAIDEFEPSRDIAVAIKKINDNSITDDNWEDLAIRCLSCSGCTSVCPTCSCYAVEDRQSSELETVRTRYWDSCLYEGFQKEASGHNPGSKAGARVRRFWEHKFGNASAEQYNRYTCVGCGRCEQVCPGVIGVHSIAKRIAQL